MTAPQTIPKSSVHKAGYALARKGGRNPLDGSFGASEYCAWEAYHRYQKSIKPLDVFVQELKEHGTRVIEVYVK